MKIRYDGLIFSFEESDSEILSKMHEEHHYCGMFDHKGLKKDASESASNSSTEMFLFN